MEKRNPSRVNKAATPNRMGQVGESDRTTARAKTIAFQNNSRKAPPVPVETCPWCGWRLKPNSFQLVRTLPDGGIQPDTSHPDQLRLLCQNPGCRFRGRNTLPIVAVDEPLYRRVPCFVIATIDKFASLPWTGASGALLGGADRQDAAGFYGPWEPGVGQKLPKPLAPPDLIIQDELHLISGPLGTMAGLYETVIDALCSRTVGSHVIRPKVIASTATVRRAESHIRALFTRAGVEVFPPPGPDRRTSFFARTVPLESSPGRLYVGLAAPGRSLKVILLRTYLSLLAAAQKCWEEAGGAKNEKNPADPYMTLVGYFNSLRELGGSRRIVEDEVASQATVRSERRRVNETEGSFANRTIAREVCELTSREATDKVSDTKRRLAIGFVDKDKSKERVDVALATNMISVGLDIIRLGLMVVLGQTRQTYLRGTNGHLWGRPVDGHESKYLLTGMSRCGVCGGTMIVRSRSDGRQRAYFYACSSFHHRGKTVCPNSLDMRLEVAEEAILSALEQELLDPEILQAAAARAAARVATPAEDVDGRRHALETALGHTEAALARLTQAIAEGGAVSTLVQAIRDQERRHQTLRADLADLDRPRVVPLNVAQLKARLLEKSEEWRALLRKHAPIARQIVRKLVDGRIVFTPDPEARRYRFTMPGTLTNFFSGIVCPLAMASPTGLVRLWNWPVDREVRLVA